MLTELLKLDRPLISIDVETTGVTPAVDRVVQIGVCKIRPDGQYTEWETLVNPEVHIPEEASAVHHITDEMVKDAPTFWTLAPKLLAGLKNCDIIGYNVAAFDVKILQAEFDHCSLAWTPDGIIDGFKIYQRMFPRNLTAAVKEYLGEDLEGAHGALIDARATLRVVEAQLLRHTELPRSVKALHALFFETAKAGALDPDGKIVWKNGEACISFGKKHAGNSLKMIAATDRGFLKWMLKSEFSAPVKKIVTEALAGKFPEKT